MMKRFLTRLVFVFIMMFVISYYNFGFLLWDDNGNEKKWVSTAKKINDCINWTVVNEIRPLIGKSKLPGDLKKVLVKIRIEGKPNIFFKFLWIITDNVTLQYRSREGGKVKGKAKNVSKEDKEVFKFFSGYFGLSSGFCLFNIMLSRKITLGFFDLNFNFIQSLIFLIRSTITVISSYEEPKKEIEKNELGNAELKKANDNMLAEIPLTIFRLWLSNTLRLNLLSLNFSDYIKIRVAPISSILEVLFTTFLFPSISFDFSEVPWSCDAFLRTHISVDDTCQDVLINVIKAPNVRRNCIGALIWPSIEINIKGFLKK